MVSGAWALTVNKKQKSWLSDNEQQNEKNIGCSKVIWLWNDRAGQGGSGKSRRMILSRKKTEEGEGASLGDTQGQALPAEDLQPGRPREKSTCGGIAQTTGRLELWEHEGKQWRRELKDWEFSHCVRPCGPGEDFDFDGE